MKVSCIISPKLDRKICLRSKWWSLLPNLPVIVLLFTLLMSIVGCEEPQLPENGIAPPKYREAEITVFVTDVTATEPKKDQHIYKIIGKYGMKSQLNSVSGMVVHGVSQKENGKRNHYGCTQYDYSGPSASWISLVERGHCNFYEKVIWATKANATAIVVYNNSTQKDRDIMDHEAASIVSVIISKEQGHTIIQYLEKEKNKVQMEIVPGEEKNGNNPQNTISKTSVLFVSISFIVLMIISLAWLGFYYIQRFRYSHAKERLARRLACAAKKAIAKIPQKTIKSGDKELENDFDQCAVCIEPYKAHDVIRILPCRHVFHKSCVDPWLLDQRSCPMCKLDILRAYGMQVGGSQESVRPDPESNHIVLPRAVVHVDEPEASSSVEEAHNDEIKILLVPHACLHFHSGKDKSRSPGDPPTGLQGGGPSGDAVSSKSCQGGTKSSACNTRVERCDEEAASGSSELKSLLQRRSSAEEIRWEHAEQKDEDLPGDVDSVDGCADVSYKECHGTDITRQSHKHILGASPTGSPDPHEKEWEEGSSTCSCVTGDSEDDDHGSEMLTVSEDFAGLHDSIRESNA